MEGAPALPGVVEPPPGEGVLGDLRPEKRRDNRLPLLLLALLNVSSCAAVHGHISSELHIRMPAFGLAESNTLNNMLVAALLLHMSSSHYIRHGIN